MKIISDEIDLDEKCWVAGFQIQMIYPTPAILIACAWASIRVASSTSNKPKISSLMWTHVYPYTCVVY